MKLYAAFKGPEMPEKPMATRAGQRSAPTKGETPVQDAEGWGGGHDEEATAKGGDQGPRAARPVDSAPSCSQELNSNMEEQK